MGKAKGWQRLEIKDSQGKPLKGVEYRDYGKDGRSYRLREMVGGKSYTDSLGVKPLNEVLNIRTTLKQNRSSGTPPLTYAEMLEEQNQQRQVEKIQAQEERKEIIQKAHFEKNNTFDKYFHETYYPDRLKRKGSANQNRTVKGHYTNWIKPLIGDMPFTDFTYRDIDRIIYKMREAGKNEATINHVIGTLGNIWRRATADELISRPFPRAKAERITVDNNKTCYITKDEAKLLLATLRDWNESDYAYDMYCYTILSLYSGLRAGEIYNLTWGGIEAGRVRLTKNGKARVAHFNMPEISIMLDERRERSPDVLPGNYLMPREFNGVMLSKHFSKVIEFLKFNQKPHRLDNRMEKVDFHCMRHTFASWLAMAGESLHTIMVLMGHSSIKMVLRYAQLSPEYTRKSVLKISDIAQQEQAKFLERINEDQKTHIVH